MTDLSLFLGFQYTSKFEKSIYTQPLFEALVHSEGYLQKLMDGSSCFLGKYISPQPTLEELELMENHILSLLKKIAPNYPFSSYCLILIPVSHGQ